MKKIFLFCIAISQSSLAEPTTNNITGAALASGATAYLGSKGVASINYAIDQKNDIDDAVVARHLNNRLRFKVKPDTTGTLDQFSTIHPIQVYSKASRAQILTNYQTFLNKMVAHRAAVDRAIEAGLQPKNLFRPQNFEDAPLPVLRRELDRQVQVIINARENFLRTGKTHVYHFDTFDKPIDEIVTKFDNKADALRHIKSIERSGTFLRAEQVADELSRADLLKASKRMWKTSMKGVAQLTGAAAAGLATVGFGLSAVNSPASASEVLVDEPVSR